MNNRVTAVRAALACLGAAALIAPCAWGGSIRTEGWIRVEGDSTLHKWTSTATVIELDVEPAGAESVSSGQVKSLELRVPVAGLKSGESGLDKNLRKAMKADAFPAVVYRLSSHSLSPAVQGTLAAATTGELTICGTTRQVSMPLEVRPSGDVVSVSGSYTLLMSDYGIAPPKLMMGAIKVRDSVTIRFDLILQKETKR